MFAFSWQAFVNTMVMRYNYVGDIVKKKINGRVSGENLQNG